jgi:hypothetical protein
MVYTAAWNTVVYCPRIKLSFLLVPWQYTPAPVPLFVLKPCVYQISHPFRVETPSSIHFYQGIWSWRVYHRHVSVYFYQTPYVGLYLFHVLSHVCISKTFRLRPHERTKCVRCNALCDVHCRNRKKPIDPNIWGTHTLVCWYLLVSFYFYTGRHKVRYNRCILCARVAPA